MQSRTYFSAICQNWTNFLCIVISRSLNILKDYVVLFFEIFNTIELIHFYVWQYKAINKWVNFARWLDVVQEKTEFTEYLGERLANFAFLLKNILP